VPTIIVRQNIGSLPKPGGHGVPILRGFEHIDFERLDQVWSALRKTTRFRHSREGGNPSSMKSSVPDE
jgi:hypothetical protein